MRACVDILDHWIGNRRKLRRALFWARSRARSAISSKPPPRPSSQNGQRAPPETRDCRLQTTSAIFGMASATASASTLASAPPTTYEARAPVSIRSNTTPRRIAIADLTPNNIGQLRRLNSVLFPVAYSQRFYTDVLAPGVQDICKLGECDSSTGSHVPSMLKDASDRRTSYTPSQCKHMNKVELVGGRHRADNRLSYDNATAAFTDSERMNVKARLVLHQGWQDGRGDVEAEAEHLAPAFT